MEWIDGPTLGRRIAEQALSPREAARIARDLARAIERVHAAGMVHRDTKPDNVLLAAEPTPADPPVPKLIDFGLARPDEPESGITQVSAVVGTPAFMAPEQTGRDPTLGPVGPATDIHGLGATLYCMLTGRAPYHGAATAESLTRAAVADYPALAVLAPTAPADRSGGAGAEVGPPPSGPGAGDTNAGTITGEYGVYASGDIGTFINRTGAVVSGTGSGYGFYSGGAVGTFTNEAGLLITSASGAGIRVNADGYDPGTVVNAGVIEGATAGVDANAGGS